MARIAALVFAVAALGVAGTLFLARPAPDAGLPEVTTLLPDPGPGAAVAQEGALDISTIPDMVLGAEDAPITMIEYSSYTCPHCRDFHEGPFKQIKENWIDTGKVRLIYREAYFDRYGLWASMIARCAGPERFFPITERIFATQSEWTRAGGPAEIAAELRKIGKVAGMDDATLDACLQDGQKARTLVAWYQHHFDKDGIRGTPTFVINGELVENRPYEGFVEIFERELGN